MTLSTLAVSAIAPSLLLMWFFHRRDIFPEPPKILWATFALGVFTIPFVLLIAGPLLALGGVEQSTNPFYRAAGKAFLGAAIPEELLKFTVVYFFSARRSAFDEPMDGVVYGAAASLGFATLENILYVATGDLSTAILRAFTAVPGHAFCGALMGYFIGQSKFKAGGKGRNLFAALFWPILLHGVYDFGLMLGEAFKKVGITPTPDQKAIIGYGIAASLLALIVEVVWVLKVQSRLRKAQRGPQPRGPISVAGAWARVLFGAGLAIVGGLITLGMSLGLLVNDRPDLTTTMIVILAFLGLLPSLGGSVLFAKGVGRLNATSAVR